MLPRRRLAKRAVGWAAGGLASCALLGGCVRPLARPKYSPQTQSALVVVSMPPPPGRIEVVPPRATPSSVWVDGEWVWRRRRWAWLPGRWVEPPSGATFSPWVFVRGRDGRLWTAPGLWRDAHGAGLPPPAVLAAAHVESAQVVDSEAEVVVTGPVLPASSPSTNRAAPRALSQASRDAGPDAR